MVINVDGMFTSPKCLNRMHMLMSLVMLGFNARPPLPNLEFHAANTNKAELPKLVLRFFSSFELSIYFLKQSEILS